MTSSLSSSRNHATGQGRLGGLRSFFRFARKRKVVLVDPTAGVPLTKRSPFKGVVLTAQRQRQLFSRWTSDEETVEPSEALVGVLALLHGRVQR